MKFVNERITPISTISYVPTIDGIEGDEQTYEFLQPIAADGETFTLPVTLPNFDEPKAADVLLDITKINGVTVDFGADIRPNANGTAAVFNPVPDHNVLIVDYTTPGCLWALRTNIGFEKLKEKYGDKVIRASFDINGPMWCEPFGYIPFTPTCLVDGFGAEASDPSGLIDPYYGEGSAPLGILDYVERYMTQPHLGNVKILSAQWADADQTEINVVTEASIGMSNTCDNDWHIPYGVEFILLEDGMEGDGPEWEQLNGYAEQTINDPNLQPLTKLPYTITNMVYNDVAVGHYPEANYMLQSYTYGEPQQQTFTLKLSELTQSIIQDKSKLSVVAYFSDYSNKVSFIFGVVIDSDKSPIKAYSSDVQNIKQNATPHDVYDLSGRMVKAAAMTLGGLPKGVYIYGGKKIVIGSK